MYLPAEFQKNIWRDFTFSRLASIFALVGLMVYLDLQMRHALRQVAPILQDYVQQSQLTYTPLLYFTLMFIWASYRIAHAVLNEVNEATWDNQRMSALSSWDLTFGFLIGTNLYCWLAGLALLAVQLMVAWVNGGDLLALQQVTDMALLTLICHAFILMSSLQSVEIHQLGATQKLRGMGHLLFGLITTWSLQQFMTFAVSNHISWYGLSLSSTLVYAEILVILLIAISQYMRYQLGYKTSVLFWGAAVIWAMVFVSGFMQEQLSLYISWARQMPAFWVALCAVVYMIVREALSPITYRRLYQAIALQQWRDVGAYFPRWAMSYILAALVGLWAILYQELDVFVVTGFLAFVLRDVLIMHFLLLSGRRERIVLSWLFIMGLSYILLPAVLSYAFGTTAGVLLTPMALLSPFVSENIQWTVLISGLVQVGVMLMLVLAHRTVIPPARG